MKKRETRKDWDLWLYIAGPSPKSSRALSNLQQICDEHLAGRYHITIVDLMKNPGIARDDQILAIPTVVRKEHSPVRKMIGDLSNTGRVLAGLDIPIDAPFRLLPAPTSTKARLLSVPLLPQVS